MSKLKIFILKKSLNVLGMRLEKNREKMHRMRMLKLLEHVKITLRSFGSTLNPKPVHLVVLEILKFRRTMGLAKSYRTIPKI